MPSIQQSYLGRVARRYPMLTFVLLTFAWTWGYGSFAILYLDAPVVIVEVSRIPAIWGPLLSAGTVIYLNGGNLRAWAGQVTTWRTAPYWYVVAFGLPIALTEMAALIYLAAGYPVEYGGLQPVWLYVAGFFVILLTMGALEEFGWRGFAQPVLQERYSAVHAALLIGVLWAVWHYYLFFHEVPWTQDVNIAFYTARLVTVSLIYAWIYNGTGGSVLLVMIYHAAGNLAPMFQPATDVPAWVDTLAGLPSNIVVQVTIGVVLVWLYGPQYLADSGPDVEPSTLLGR